ADARLNRALAQIKDACDLFIAALFYIAQHERRAILIRQRRNRARHSRAAFFAHERHILQRAYVRRIEFRRLALLTIFEEARERNEPTTFAAAQFADGKVGGDAIDV